MSKSLARHLQYLTRNTFHATRRVTYPFHRDTLDKLNKNISELLLPLSLLQQEMCRRDLETTKEIATLLRANQVSYEFRSWLNAPDAIFNFNEACDKKHENTGLWFVEGSTFSSWLEQRNSFMWLNGFAGTGKSVLCSTAIEHTVRQRGSNLKNGFACFFFSFSDLDKQDTSAMLRALVLQLAGQLEDDTIPKSYSNQVATPANKDLQDLLRQIIQEFDQVYLFLDALDESPREKHREAVLQTVSQLHAWSEPGLHILVTSRDEIDIRDEMLQLEPMAISMKNSAIDEDVSAFVKQSLQKHQLRRWKKYHDRIHTTLTKRAGGK